eukprot:CCRYP_019365-RA/>CCRYP_019365-RA protein AED:0.03 eAED:0.03 QI:818/1/1/1/1/1/2/104/71
MVGLKSNIIPPRRRDGRMIPIGSMFREFWSLERGFLMPGDEIGVMASILIHLGGDTMAILDLFDDDFIVNH